MNVLGLTTQKGGAGKSTLAISLAVAAVEAGERVIAIDLDPQGTLSAWGKRRGDEDENLLVERVEPHALAQAVANARAQGIATLAIVDTPGVFASTVSVAVASIDFALIPVKPTIIDIEAVRPVLGLLRTNRKPFGFVLSQVNAASSARNLDAAAALMAEGMGNPPMIAARSDFIDSAAAGKGVTEWAPKGKGAAEIRFLWRYVRAQLDGVHNG
ncbi:ParA family protein [Methylobacterium sp.]|uniref:ParA family protein n=1 Tax=Methylobacterium sp. TaxID=409 RepID=UPI0025E7DB96|nr:ParA family protein [Methylobacterium sp.]MBY0260135.1 ParA family protein [Methylobacterium sp.]